jgi:hypothetical protein
MTTNTGPFWDDFDRMLYKPLDEVITELGDHLAAWDEIPDVSEEFVFRMNEAYLHISQAQVEMRRARNGGQS